MIHGDLCPGVIDNLLDGAIEGSQAVLGFIALSEQLQQLRVVLLLVGDEDGFTGNDVSFADDGAYSLATPDPLQDVDVAWTASFLRVGYRLTLTNKHSCLRNPTMAAPDLDVNFPAADVLELAATEDLGFVELKRGIEIVVLGTAIRIECVPQHRFAAFRCR